MNVIRSFVYDTTKMSDTRTVRGNDVVCSTQDKYTKVQVNFIFVVFSSR